MSRRRIRSKVVGVVAVVLAVLMSGAVLAKPDDQGMADRIATHLTEAASLYRDGSRDAAKLRVQKAYFEVFENLRTPSESMFPPSTTSNWNPNSGQSGN